jgi:hypothetical protein
VVLKLPVLLVNVTGLAQVVPVPPVLNVAVTERVAVIDVVQVPVPVHAPLHPANVDRWTPPQWQRHRSAACEARARAVWLSGS